MNPWPSFPDGGVQMRGSYMPSRLGDIDNERLLSMVMDNRIKPTWLLAIGVTS